MPKRRRKLSPEMEKDISTARRKVELITAIINDIEEEDIQGEYRMAFDKVRNSLLYLVSLYDQTGFNTDTQEGLNNYNQLIKDFESEYEI